MSVGDERMEVLRSGLAALDRLNAWVRADLRGEGWRVQGVMRRVVYCVKLKAILEATKRLEVGLRRVAVRKGCRVCGGTGVFYGHDVRDAGEACRTCGATGQVTLRFIETRIGEMVWHTPWERWWSAGLDVYVPFQSHYGQADADLFYHFVEDWEPGRPGRELPLEVVHADSLTVLHAWPAEFSFIVDFHYHAPKGKLMRSWRCPDIGEGERWLGELFCAAEAKATLESRSTGVKGEGGGDE